MIRFPNPMRAAWAACVLLAWLVTMPAQAESLSKVETRALPGIDTDQPLQGLLAVDGHPLAMTAQQAWLFDAQTKGWVLSQWNPAGSPGSAIKGNAGNGQLAVLLRGPVQGTAVTGVDRVSLANGQPVAHPLPALSSSPSALCRRL